MTVDYKIDTTFEPLHELINSLHTYICRKSYKKIDLTSAWAKETRKRLTPEFASLLDQTEVDSNWKLTYLLVHLCPEKQHVHQFLSWLEGLGAGDLYELMSEYSSQFPDNMAAFKSRTLSLFSEWNELYFQHIDPVIIQRLQNEAENRKALQPAMDSNTFVDETTNGLCFKPMKGLEKLLLIPQYHFQPINVVSSFRQLTICNYAARIYFNDEEDLPPHEYRIIRSLAEMSRLKILRYLHQGPRSFIEIVRHLQLSKGITHDHISKLRSAGLIYAHFEGETLTEYSLREGALLHLQNKLTSYIKNQ
ncbi:winged helix-turn-helix domain-containing protein [Paenibacillus chondroitinus]|uniref:Winged helix-turn-helix domain-containing protein n=1 Tax=Paenibacillus chondroitinus TaxID=59842 RepID=A0ABU6D6N9_9BACL|nr:MULTISPECIES: winged helix-turn-helix domain-containing protein [Paenibacillus]MCY9660045.1 winged helix-turn-helix domain-containing protein [Paenibacillus anseongense]MEB4793096.1 winged helix-turn-helix domain-containing protein [Paenibacillus chondroitinus]